MAEVTPTLGFLRRLRQHEPCESAHGDAIEKVGNGVATLFATGTRTQSGQGDGRGRNAE